MSEQSLVERLREDEAYLEDTTLGSPRVRRTMRAAASRIATLEAALGEAREFIAGDSDIVDIPGGAASRLLARLDAALSSSPSGMVMVPGEEMTETMVVAGQRYLDERCLSGTFDLPATFNWHEFWQALLAASPRSG